MPPTGPDRADAGSEPPAGLRIAGDAPPSGPELARMRQAAGWPEVAPAALARSVAAGRWVTARLSDGRLVGCGRAMGDGVLYGSIWDMIVLPAYRRRGIGRRIFLELMRELAGASLVALIATAEGAPLYMQYGFGPESRGSRALMLRPNP